MAVAEWSGMVWEVAPGSIRPIGSISGSRSVSIERNDDKEGQPATQTVAMDLATCSIEYLEVRSATGYDPRARFERWCGLIGTYAPLYLNGRFFLAERLLLTSVSFSDVELAADGSVLSMAISLEFEEYQEDAAGLKTERGGAIALRPGVATQTAASAVAVGPTERQKQGKMPANPGM